MTENKELWLAVYLPASPKGRSLDRYDFESKEEAYEYMFSKMCKGCKAERERFLNGTSDPNNPDHEYDGEFPACSCEWEVCPSFKWLSKNV